MAGWEKTGLGFSVGDQIRDEDSLGHGSGNKNEKEELLQI